MMGDENIHMCTEPPFEAAVYNFEAKNGEDLQKFRANSKADLTVDVEQSSDEHQEKKKEPCCLELPVDFSKEEFARIRFDVDLQFSIMIK